MKKVAWIGIVLILAAQFTCRMDHKFHYQTRYMVVVVVDGPRYTETWGTRTNIPIRAALAAKGALYTNFHNDGVTFTCPGHAAICTGVYENIDNAGLQLPTYPSVFQYYLSHTGFAEEKCQVISNKSKLFVLANCADSIWKNKYMAVTDCGASGPGSANRSDSATFTHTLQVLKNVHPHLLLVNLAEADVYGHANNWKAYINAIQQSDKYIGELWAYIQNDPVYANKTTLLVTNDHGRHPDGYKDGFISHGDECASCRHIELFAIGPDIKPGIIIEGNHGQVDIAATIAELLDFEMPTGKGKVLREMMK